MDNNLEQVLSKKLSDVENNLLKNLERMEHRWSSDKDAIKDIILLSHKNTTNTTTNSNNKHKKKVMLAESINQHRKLDNFERTLKGFVSDMESSLRDIVSPDWNTTSNNNNQFIDGIDNYNYPSSVKTKKASPRADSNGYKLVLPANSVTIHSTTTSPITPNRGRGGRPSSNSSNRSNSPTKHPFFVNDYNALDLSTMNDYATRTELENLENKMIDSFREMVRAQEQQTVQLNTVAEVVLTLQENYEALNERPKSAVDRLTSRGTNSNTRTIDNDNDNKMIEFTEIFDKKVNNINNAIQKRLEKMDDECYELTGKVTETKKSLENWKSKFGTIDSTYEEFREALDKIKLSIASNTKAIDSSIRAINDTTISEVNSRLNQLEASVKANTNTITNSITKSSTSTVTFKEGDMVEVNRQGRGVWYTSKISLVKNDGTYDITYDADSTVDLSVASAFIRYIDPQTLIAGIMNKLSGFESRITSIATNTAAETKKGIDRNTNIDEIISRLSKLEEGAMSNSGQYKEGDKVEGNYRGKGKWHSAKIAKDRGQGKYDLSYDGGESESRVDKELIRAISTTTEKKSESVPVITSTTLNDILDRLKKLEDNQNVNIDSSINDSKVFNDLVKKVNKIEENVNKAMGDVFERLRSIEKNLPASSKITEFESYMTKNNEALFVLQGKIMEIIETKEKRPSSKKDRRKSTSDSSEISVSRSSSTKDNVLAATSTKDNVLAATSTKDNALAATSTKDNALAATSTKDNALAATSTKDNSLTKKTIANSITNNITFNNANINDSSKNIEANTNTDTNANDDWEVASVKTESDPFEIIQSSIDAIKQQIAQEEANINRLAEEKATLKSQIKEWIAKFKKANGREPNESEKTKEKGLFQSYQEKVFLKEDAELFSKELQDKLRLKETELTNMKNSELFNNPTAESLEFQKIKDTAPVDTAPVVVSDTNSTAEVGRKSIKNLNKSGSSSERRISSREGSRESSREGSREGRRNTSPNASEAIEQKPYKTSFNGGATTSLINYARHEADRKLTSQFKKELETSAKLADPKFEEERLRSQIKAAETDLVAINEEKSYRKNMIREFINGFKAKNGREPTAQDKQDNASEMFMLYNEILKRKDETEARINKLMVRLSNLSTKQ